MKWTIKLVSLIFLLIFSFATFNCSAISSDENILSNESDLSPAPHHNWYYDMDRKHFVSEKIGFDISTSDKHASKEWNSIHKTTDGGLTWQTLPEIMASNYEEGWLVDFKFINENIGFITKTSGNIFKTCDGGLTWNCINNNLPKYELPENYISGSSNIHFNEEKIEIYQKIYFSECEGEGYFAPSYHFAESQNEYDANILGVKSHAIFVSKDLGESWEFEKILDFYFG